MGFLTDRIVLTEIDILLVGMAASSNRLMRRLVALGFRPNGELPTLLFSCVLFVEHYNQVRGSDISDSLNLAKARTLGNPIIQKYLASKTVDGINQMAGV